MFKILSIHITTEQEKTWGRVYIQYEIDGQLCFIFKNWIKFAEHTYKGFGDILDEPSYNWFTESNRHVFTDVNTVLLKEADNLGLTSEKYKVEYGTPSTILKRLLIELKANYGEAVENRRGWFDRLPKAPVVSPILINSKNQIWLTAYDTEIILEPLLKTVYLLFLKHPEGIVLNQMDSHKAEIEAIYKLIRPDGAKGRILTSLENLTNIEDNSLHEKLSKIKKILVNELGEAIAANYIISGNKNEAYRTNISSDKIVFE